MRIPSHLASHFATHVCLPPQGTGRPSLGPLRTVLRNARRRLWLSKWQPVSGGSPPGTRRDHRLQRLESILFLAREPLTTRRLSQYANLADGTEARTLIRRLNDLYDSNGQAFRVERVAGGYQLLTRPAFVGWVRRLDHVPPETRLSAPALETLAVVAYRQPVVRAEVEAIRGVSCGEILRQLMERELVRISGRSDDLGRPYLYATTRQFLRMFGLDRLDDLPRVPTLQPHAKNGKGMTGEKECFCPPTGGENQGDQQKEDSSMPLVTLSGMDHETHPQLLDNDEHNAGCPGFPAGNPLGDDTEYPDLQGEATGERAFDDLDDDFDDEDLDDDDLDDDLDDEDEDLDDDEEDDEDDLDDEDEWEEVDDEDDWDDEEDDWEDEDEEDDDDDDDWP